MTNLHMGGDDLPDDYIEQYCPFCGEEHENLDDDMDAVHWEDED